MKAWNAIAPGVVRAIQRNTKALEQGAGVVAQVRQRGLQDYKGSQLKYRQAHEPGFINKRPQ